MPNEPRPRITTTCPNITEDRLEQLKDIFPEAFSEAKIDFEKLRESLGDIVEDNPERYSFSWAGKRDAIRILQTPSRATLVPVRDESLDFDSTQNIFIEGDNLEALKLLYKPYFGRVKMIYIDPPYNTGNDFIYPDNFTDPLDNYLKLTGQKDAEGNLLISNPESGGRYHSAWLSMLYPRLFLARQLLSDDGVIFISIDDHEIHNLRILLNEIMGEENFIASIIWQKKYSPQNDAKYLSDMHDFVLLFAKNKEFWRPVPLARTEEQDSAYKNPDNDPRGSWKATDSTCNKSRAQRPNLYYPITNPATGEEIYPLETRVWRYSRSVHEAKQIDNRVWWGPDGKNKVPAYKSFLSEVKQGRVPTTIWTYQEVGHNQSARQELNALIPGNTFDTPKPVDLIKRMLEISTTSDEDDIILDFFAGSSATAQAVIKLNHQDGGNRHYIMVQLPEPTKDGEFATIAEIGKERIRRVAKKMRKDRNERLPLDKAGDLGFRVFKLTTSSFNQWEGKNSSDTQAYTDQMQMFADPLVVGWKEENVVYEVAIKEGLGLNISVEKSPVENIYLVKDPGRNQTFYITLAKSIQLHDLRPLNLKADDLFICRDTSLDDETAANLALQCRMKTI